jgi:hypothetical protein
MKKIKDHSDSQSQIVFIPMDNQQIAKRFYNIANKILYLYYNKSNLAKRLKILKRLKTKNKILYLYYNKNNLAKRFNMITERRIKR